MEGDNKDTKQHRKPGQLQGRDRTEALSMSRIAAHASRSGGSRMVKPNPIKIVKIQALPVKRKQNASKPANKPRQLPYNPQRDPNVAGYTDHERKGKHRHLDWQRDREIQMDNYINGVQQDEDVPKWVTSDYWTR